MKTYLAHFSAILHIERPCRPVAGSGTRPGSPIANTACCKFVAPIEPINATAANTATIM